MIIQGVDNVELNLDDPLNPIMDLKVPIYVVREEEYTSAVKFETPEKYLFETVEKSFTLASGRYTGGFSITNLNIQSFKQELSHHYRIKKKCIYDQEHRFEYDNKKYRYIGAIFFTMEDKYYYLWKAKYRNILLEQILR
tara:strand:- start:5734 stop:6150 length:417 start_codon:yes stop_codon:yes gene_type:complete